MSMRITRRSVVEEDREFLVQLYASTRDAEMAQVPWTAEQKRAFVEMQFAAQTQSYAASHPRADHDILCWDQQPVGRLYLDRGPGLFQILDITVAPERRNAGIGSAVLQEVLAEADREGCAVSIYVESPGVRLFERLGFRPKSVSGFLALMERPAAGSAAAAPAPLPDPSDG